MRRSTKHLFGAVSFVARSIVASLVAGLVAGLVVGLVASPVLAQQPVQAIAEGSPTPRAQSTVLGVVDRLDWAPDAPGEWVEGSALEWRVQQTPAGTFTELTWMLSDATLANQPTNLPMLVEAKGQSTRMVFSFDPEVWVVGPVAPGTTLWSVASRWKETLEVDVPTQALIDALIAANPQAFERPEPSGLLAGAMLRLVWEQLAPEDLVETGDIAKGNEPATQHKTPSPWQAIGTQDWLDAIMARQLASQARAPDEKPTTHGNAQTKSHAQQWLDPQRMGPVALLGFAVVVAMLFLHGVSARGGDARAPIASDKKPKTAPLSPQALAVTMSLAEQYLALGDAAQALHWLEEVIRDGDPKTVRRAKKMWREAQSMVSPESIG